jgi:hemolysin activation/secretion protein
MRGGQEEAQVDAVVRVSDEPALKYSFTADNTGTQQTGNFRVGVGFQHSNLTNHDDILSMQYVTGPNDDKQPNHLEPYPSKAVFIVGGAYKIPLYELGDSFEISSGYSNVNSGVVANLFNISGSGSIFGLRYNHNLRRSGDLDHKLTLSWDWRAYHSMVNQADTGGPSLVPDVTVQPLGLTYSGNYRAATHETSFYFGWFQNMPSENDAGQKAFDASRVGADAHYTLQHYGINHNRSFANDMQFRVAFSGQFTRNKLVSGEMWGIGGADSVRGFLEREIINDWGYRGSVEMYSPDFASKIPDVSNGTRMRALVFYDWGLAQRNAPTAAEVAGQHIASFGLGFRISSGTNMFTRIDYGVVLDPGGLQGRWDGRVHASFSYLF